MIVNPKILKVLMKPLESVIHQLDHKRFYYIITYGICFISLGLGAASMGPLLPSLANNIGVSIAQISFLFAASSIGYLAGSAGGGRLYDRFNGHHLMIFALGLMVIVSILIPLFPSLYLLFINMFFFGMGQGFLDIGANVNILWVYQSKVGPYMNALHFCFGVGAFLSPIIIQQVMTSTEGSLATAYWTLALLFLPGVIGLLLLKSPTNPEKEDQTVKANTKNTRLIFLMMLLFFIYVGVETGFGGWIFTYVLKVRIADESTAAYINAIFWGALTIGRLLSIPLAKKLTPSQLLIGNFILGIFFLALILGWPINPMVVWISSAGLGLAFSSVFPTLLSLGETRMKITGGVTGLFFLAASLGGMLFPMLLGQIFEYLGSYQIMIALFILICVGLLVLVLMLIASKRAGEKIRS